MMTKSSLATFSPGISHVTHSLVFDEARGILFVHQGSSCDLCREENPERATITAFDLDGSNRRIWASGLRNAIGYDLHPVTVLLGLMIWGMLWGIPGMFLSVPIMVMFAIVCARFDGLKPIAIILSADGKLTEPTQDSP